MIDAIFTGLKLIASPVTEWLKGRNERKQVKLESEIEITRAQTTAMIQRMTTQQEADIAWERLSIGNSSWKDEFWTILIATPVALVFIPGMDVHVLRGFEVLGALPDWYRWALGVAIGSAFGVRQFANFKRWQKGA